MQPPDWFGFWGQVCAAFIGALAAFLFALWQSRLQNERERRARLLEERDRDILALKAVVDAAGMTLEELVNYKAQTLSELAIEAEQLAKALEGGSPAEIAKVAEHLPNFFQELPLGSFVQMPPAERFAFAIDYAPAITKFVHRASSVPHQLNAAIETRNDLLRRWADAVRRGASGNDVRYFLTMLVSSARAIASHADDAIFFATLLHDQCYFIGVEKFQRPTFRSFRLDPVKAKLLMSDDYVAGYRKQVVTFGRPTPPRVIGEAVS